MDPASLRRLFDYMAWADAEVLRALGEAGDLPRTALELFAHVLGAELVWLDRLLERAQSTAVWPDADLEGCATLARRSREGFGELLDGLDAAELARPVAYRNSAGRDFVTPAGDILVHVALHGAYHRGQVARALSEAGCRPAPTDYIGFVRGAPAATREDAER